jgi:hypothetical protein
VEVITEDTFEAFRKLAESDPETNLLVHRLTTIGSYQKFLRVLYQDLDQVIQVLQERKQIYCDKKEDDINMAIVDLLRQRQYKAEHDPKIGGHIDILIRGRDPSFLWIGESKRDKGPKWMAEGMEQLSNRYSDGTIGRDHGGMFMYIQGMKANQIFKTWRDELAKSTEFDDLKISDSAINPKSVFFSEHTHSTSGETYKVRHMAVALYHSPTK